MAVVTYKCDVCNRTIDKTQNPQGLEVVGRCVITASCKGSLFKIGTKGSGIARGFPAPVAGLADWRKRRVLYDHSQPVQSKLWNITHNLNTNPSVQTFVYRQLGLPPIPTLVEIEPVSVTYIDKNTLTVQFSNDETGVVQCISRNATRTAAKSVDVIQNIDLTINADIDTLTTKQTLTVATLAINPTIQIGVDFLSSRDLSVVAGVDLFEFGNTNALSLWHPHETVFIKGKFYRIHCCVIDLVNLTNAGVKDGFFFHFTTIDGNPILKGDAFLLLPKAPNISSIDKDLNNIIDLSIATADNASLHFLFYDNDMKYSVSSKQTIFPAITIAQ